MAGTNDKCLEALDVLLPLLQCLGFQINYNTLEGACQQVVFLGIIMDSVSIALSIHQWKMGEVREYLQSFYASRKVTKHKIQQLAGKLN